MPPMNVRFLSLILAATSIIGCSSIVESEQLSRTELLLTGNIAKDWGAKPEMSWAMAAPLKDDEGRQYDLIMACHSLGDSRFEFRITYNEEPDSPQKGFFSFDDNDAVAYSDPIPIRWPKSAASGQALELILQPTLSARAQTAHLVVR